MQLAQALWIALFQALVKAVAQGRVVAVFGVVALGHLDDQVQALQLAQGGRHIGRRGEFAGKAGIEHLGHGGLFEKLAQRHGQALQAFFFEELPGMDVGLAGDRA
ncbi:hypothetical protein D3C76_1191280 [compost metagenome]